MRKRRFDIRSSPMAKLSEQKAIVQDLEKQIAELKLQPGSVPREEVTRLQEQLDSLQSGAEAGNKDAWTRVLLARHPQRPYTLDYIQMLFTEFTELHGDRRFGDDGAMVGGFARFNGQSVMVVGHQKGRDTKQKLQDRKSTRLNSSHHSISYAVFCLK